MKKKRKKKKEKRKKKNVSLDSKGTNTFCNDCVRRDCRRMAVRAAVGIGMSLEWTVRDRCCVLIKAELARGNRKENFQWNVHVRAITRPQWQIRRVRSACQCLAVSIQGAPSRFDWCTQSSGEM